MIRAENGPVKVGLTSNIRRRFSELKSYSPVPLFLEFEGRCPHDAAEKIEDQTHRLLAPSRQAGEWFSVSAVEAIKALNDIAAELGFCLENISLATIKPRPKAVGTPVMTRCQPELLALIDEFRRKQPDLPNRPEAIRRIVEAALERGK